MLPPLRTPALRAPPCAGGMLALFVRKSVSEKRPFMLNVFFSSSNVVTAPFFSRAMCFKKTVVKLKRAYALHRFES